MATAARCGMTVATARQGLDVCVVEDWEADLEAGGEAGSPVTKRKAGAWPGSGGDEDAAAPPPLGSGDGHLHKSQ
ncbi:hypothetical protein ZWY2020_024246 [Hordeum vulgare]|nr:hypothetical protein ZWY2020_024246 [Hordeum vulgare]